MTRRAKDIIGKTVVSAANGERLGTVSDLLLDDAGTSLVGLVLSHGWMKEEHVLPAESVQTLGRDAVVSRSNELVAAKEWQARQRGIDGTPRAVEAVDAAAPEAARPGPRVPGTGNREPGSGIRDQ